MIADRRRLRLIFLAAGLVIGTTPVVGLRAASPGAVSVTPKPSACALDYGAVGNIASAREIAPGVAKGQTRYQEQIWELADSGDAAKSRGLQNALEKAMTSTQMKVIRTFGDGESAGAAKEVVIGANTRGIMKEKAGDISDPKVEVAAYVIDKQLGQNAVPVTILRQHEGVEVSVQASVTEASLLNQSKTVRDKAQKTDPEALQFFDHLISNYDRTGGNYFVQGGRLVAIDNGAGFVTRTSTFVDSLRAAMKLPRESAVAQLRRLCPSQAVFRKLEATSVEEWRAILRPYLSESQMQMFLESRTETIQNIQAARALFGDAIFR